MAIKNNAPPDIHFFDTIRHVLAVPSILGNDHWVACYGVFLCNAKIHVVVFANP